RRRRRRLPGFAEGTSFVRRSVAHSSVFYSASSQGCPTATAFARLCVSVSDDVAGLWTRAPASFVKSCPRRLATAMAQFGDEPASALRHLQGDLDVMSVITVASHRGDLLLMHYTST
ncbi:MAG: hypothetical protein ACKPKO_17300, partial [Candidatus Fonsibacter sp.]